MIMLTEAANTAKSEMQVKDVAEIVAESLRQIGLFMKKWMGAQLCARPSTFSLFFIGRGANLCDRVPPACG